MRGLSSSSKRLVKRKTDSEPRREIEKLVVQQARKNRVAPDPLLQRLSALAVDASTILDFVPLFVRLLCNMDDAGYLSLVVLCHLSDKVCAGASDPSDDATARVVASGGIVTLVALLHSEDELTVEMAATTVFNAWQLHPEARVSIAHVVFAPKALPPPPPPGRTEPPRLATLRHWSKFVAIQRLVDSIGALYTAVERATAVGVTGAGLVGVTLLRDEPPDEHNCPITLQPMKDPVVASDGQTYDRSAIATVLARRKEKRISPITREPLARSLRPNRPIKSLIDAYKQHATKTTRSAATEEVLRTCCETDVPEAVRNELEQRLEVGTVLGCSQPLEVIPRWLVEVEIPPHKMRSVSPHKMRFKRPC